MFNGDHKAYVNAAVASTNFLDTTTDNDPLFKDCSECELLLALKTAISPFLSTMIRIIIKCCRKFAPDL